MNVLVIGSKGMLGTDLVKELNNTNFNVVVDTFLDIDITKEEEMLKIEREKPDVIINCAAYTNVDKAETERDSCYDVNVRGVSNLVNLCKKNNIIFFHFSTDYVFDGTKYGYDEEDKPHALNYYGKTKAEGEEIIIRNLEKYYLVRTSWLFGKRGKNFVDTIINLSKENNMINVVNDQIGSPTYTVDLSKLVVNILKKKEAYNYGIYHITNNGICSWFEYAKEIVNFKKLNCLIKPCTSEEFSREAKRPKYSILNNHKVEKLRHWKEALGDYLNEK